MTKSNSNFTRAYSTLNPAQKRAVDTIDGPLLVLAGPGTGKTQIISARVANILLQTDTIASNILCLTFTDSATSNMRERLRSFIGDDAYDVTISTYHSFGSEIIKKYNEYFTQVALDRIDDVLLERPIDELRQTQIINTIVEQLPFDSSLRGARNYLRDVVSTISDLKQNLISPTKLKQIAKSNLRQIAIAQPILDAVINQTGGFSRQKATVATQYIALLDQLSPLSGDLTERAVTALSAAMAEFEETNSTKPLTSWKNTWLIKNEQDIFTLTRASDSEKMLELVEVYTAYAHALKSSGYYDFDDMILRAIEEIKNNAELRYNLQERYQYILLDEFQDTNPAQFELVKLLTNHPVHEGRPNIMAVGDDDQAIYAFQGAQVGNLQDFINSYRDVSVINLTHNYRSHPDILHLASNIARQIKDHQTKTLVASSHTLPTKSTLSRYEFDTVSAEYGWVGKHINSLIKNGVEPKEIAVLAPKHKYLENLVPFLSQYHIPISYEKRENILETEIVQGLILATQLLQALMNNDTALINKYFPLVLSLPYWQLPALEIWSVNWQFGKRGESRSWTEIAKDSIALSPAVTFYLELAKEVPTYPLEHILDQLCDASPLKAYYLGADLNASNALSYYESISHLSVIRTHLRSYQDSSDHQLKLADFLDFCDMYDTAHATLLNTQAIVQTQSAVQLMTAFKAKGLEFDHVFILHAHDDVWGTSSRGATNFLPLPRNLAHIRYNQSGDDELLRLFFVALTRARHGLYITSHTQKDNGKSVTPLKYLGEAGGLSQYFPPHAQQIITSPSDSMELAHATNLLWHAGRVSLPANLRDLLSEHLDNYYMSPTHLNSFMDLKHGGPREFLEQTLLRYPQAPSVSSEYGVAIHNTLQWYQLELNNGKSPSLDQVLARYDWETTRCYLSAHDLEDIRARGSCVLPRYLTARKELFQTHAEVEVNFAGEAVVLGKARLTGKIDRLVVDKKNKTVTIIDYKTGKPLPKWDSSPNAYKYKHQLYFYKFLLEGSITYRNYKVLGAQLEFIEPTNFKNGVVAPPLTISFNDEDEKLIKQLIKVVWDKIQTLDLPDISKYPKSIQGTKAFERDLLL